MRVITVRILRLAFAILGAVALVCVPWVSRNNAGFTIANYFSYFTILSNVIGVIVLFVGAFADPHGDRWQRIRGAATVYLVITGIVYAVLLADIDVGMDDNWMNATLHRVIPLVLLVDWVLVPPRRPIEDRQVLAWLAFPVAFGVYSLIRGPIVDWYPYPFLDPRQQGYLSLAIGLVVLVVGFVLFALSVGVLGRLAARWRYGTDARDTVA